MGAYGVGIGWRQEIAGYLATLPGLRFVEVIAESLPGPGGGDVPPALTELRDRGVAVVPHGIRLNLGGAEPLDATRVCHLAHCAWSARHW
jgi:uncharacterized protein (UPF0276 family)